MGMNEPKPINVSAGECIKVLLGSSGSQYFIVEEHIDSHQSFDWKQIPHNLAINVNRRIQQGRRLRSVAMGQNGEWFVCTVKTDGTEAAVSCGGVPEACKSLVHNVIQSSKASVHMAFGETGRYVLIQDRNGYAFGPNVPQSFKDHIKKLNSEGKEISFVRFIRGGNYYVGSGKYGWYTHGSMCAALKKEIMKPMGSYRERIIDLCVAGDGSWIVLRADKFSVSNGVDADAKSRIAKFYSSHRARQKKRAEEIKEYRLAEHRRKEKEEAAKKEKAEKEEAAKKLSRIEESLFDVKTKRLKVGDKVTVAGVSVSPGDSKIKRIDATGMVLVTQGYYDDKIIPDSRTIVRYEDYELAPDEERLLLTISDEYDAAVASYYYCVCSDNICHCRKITPSSFVSRSLLDSGKRDFMVGDHVYVQGYGNATICTVEGKNKILVKYDNGSMYHVKETNIQLINGSAPAIPQHCAFAATDSISSTLTKRKKPILEYRGETIPFDEYKCAEKIDLKRLKRIVEDLAKDRNARSNVIRKLEGSGSTHHEQWLAQLKRCSDLEMIATTLYNELKDLPTDNFDCVVREVTYEHRDPSFRGRLFAIGETVVSSQSKLPRTTTLQGMHRDLRATLVGAFAHDIDCENSEVRLLCSLAKQYGLVELVPILIDYRDNRKKWLDLVMRSHGVAQADAKILVNIIISGGRYETWRKRVNVLNGSKVVQKFVFEVDTQSRVLRDQLLKHPRFQWTSLEREKLIQQGRKGGAVDNALLPRIVQYCENEVLRLLHQNFHSMGWIVRAKIFDGLIVERGKQVTIDLETSLRAAEKACQNQGWDIRLAEKPLRGLQDDPLPAVVDARAALHKAQHFN